jgi:hypothetical protein
LREKLVPKKEDSFLPAQCNQKSFQIHPLEGGEVRGQFDGGPITSGAGGLLLEVERNGGSLAAGSHHGVDEVLRRNIIAFCERG